MKTNIFVVGLDDFHLKLLNTVTDSDRYNFLPLFHSAEIVNPVDFRIGDALPEMKRILDQFSGPIDAIIGHWDFPTSALLPILRQHYGLGGPSLETVLRCEHKYWSRLEQQKVIPKHIPRFSAFNPFSLRPRNQIDLEYPFWIKPVKAHSSYLGFRVDNDADFAHAIDEIQAKIHCVAKPFNEILAHAELPPEIEGIDGWHCVAEEIISTARQCTVEGYVHNGELVAYGFIESVRGGPHRSTFMRYEYPSLLPEPVHRRMAHVAQAVLLSVGFDNSPFNMEFFYDEEADDLFLVEVNTRISKSHCPLFFLVDGASHHQVAIKLALGEEPNFPHRQGAFPHAAKFMMRHLGPDACVRHLPSRQEFERLTDVFPEFLINVHVHDGQYLSDLALQEPYSYELADIFLGAESPAALQTRYERLCAMMPIHIEPLSDERLDDDMKVTAARQTADAPATWHHPSP